MIFVVGWLDRYHFHVTQNALTTFALTTNQYLTLKWKNECENVGANNVKRLFFRWQWLNDDTFFFLHFCSIEGWHIVTFQKMIWFASISTFSVVTLQVWLFFFFGFVYVSREKQPFVCRRAAIAIFNKSIKDPLGLLLICDKRCQPRNWIW